MKGFDSKWLAGREGSVVSEVGGGSINRASVDSSPGVLTLRVPGPPAPKPRMTQRDRWQKRPAVIRYRDYCDRIRAALAAAGSLPDGPICIRIAFALPLPARASRAERTRRLSGHHTQRPDVDNLTKSVLDALLDEDSRVFAIDARKAWAESGNTFIEITPSDHPDLDQ